MLKIAHRKIMYVDLFQICYNNIHRRMLLIERVQLCVCHNQSIEKKAYLRTYKFVVNILNNELPCLKIMTCSCAVIKSIFFEKSQDFICLRK